MVRRNKRTQPNIFTMSALDLFASALGAFVLIAVISLPYYLNEDQSDIIEAQKHELANAIKKTMECNKKESKLIANLAGMGQTNDILKSKIESQGLKIDVLKRKLKNTIQFSLLGIGTKSTSFTIVLDMSGSVSNYSRTIEDVIKKLIKPMINRCEVQVLAYSGTSKNPKIVSWTIAYNLKSIDTVEATSLIKFTQNQINNLDKTADTPTLQALEEALKYPSDAIILISDGEPNLNPNFIINKITNLNHGKQEIHTIAIGNYLKKRKLSDFLMKLSAENGGGFIGIASLD